MVTRVCTYLATALLFAAGTSFLFFTALVLLYEVVHRIEDGSLAVHGATMVLNEVWSGNEIYLVVVSYLTLSYLFYSASCFVMQIPQREA